MALAAVAESFGSCLHLWRWISHVHPSRSTLQSFPSWNWGGVCLELLPELHNSARLLLSQELHVNTTAKGGPHQLKTEPASNSTRATPAWKYFKLSNKRLFNTWQEFPGGSKGILCLETTKSSYSTLWKAAQPRDGLRHHSIISIYPNSFWSLQEASKFSFEKNVIRKATTQSISPVKSLLHRCRVFAPKNILNNVFKHGIPPYIISTANTFRKTHTYTGNILPGTKSKWWAFSSHLLINMLPKLKYFFNYDRKCLFAFTIHTNSGLLLAETKVFQPASTVPRTFDTSLFIS